MLGYAILSSWVPLHQEVGRLLPGLTFGGKIWSDGTK